MDNFDAACTYLLENEGGWVDRADDAGGPTNWGITLPILSKWRGMPQTAEDARNLQETDARKLYRDIFWTPLRLDEVPPSLATALLDTSVNEGQGFAVIAAQKAMGMVWDGVLGSKTIEALQHTDPKKFIYDFVGEIQEHYVALAVARPENRVFLKGWLARSRRLFLLV